MKVNSFQLSPVIFGTSCLGNIYKATTFENKLAIVQACIENAPDGVAVFDSAGKYGAGLALESLGKCLKELNVPKNKVVISNKLGWYQTPLTTPEPTFEKGIWRDLAHDAVQKITYKGIIECFEQGNALLGDYDSQMASVHDPDEYLFAATDQPDEKKRFQNVLDAYQALHELKAQGKVRSVGIGAKDWRTIQKISQYVDLDWVMFANSLTIYSHPQELLTFVKELHQKNISIINSAVFNGGFLVGSDYYNYTLVDKNTKVGSKLYAWRNQFFAICEQFDVKPAEACFSFSFHIPGISSIALSTTNPKKVKTNIEMTTRTIPQDFWKAMKVEGLLSTPLI